MAKKKQDKHSLVFPENGKMMMRKENFYKCRWVGACLGWPLKGREPADMVCS